MIFYIDFGAGAGWENITDYVRDTVKITERACSEDYKYATNVLDITLIYNEALFTSLHTTLGYVYVRVYEDDGTTPVFFGRFVPCVGLTFNGVLDIQQLDLSIEDYTSMLNVSMNEFVAENMYIMNPADTAHSIIHVLFTHLGLSHSLIDPSVSILDTVGAAVADDDSNALDFVSTLLFEYGWVPNWSAPGLFRPIKWIQDESASTVFTFNDDNIIGQIEESPRDLDKEAAKVYWYGLAERAATRVYTESLDYDEDGDFEGYPILRETYFPDEANVIDETTGTFQVVEQEYTETGVRYGVSKYIQAGYSQDFALEHADFTRVLVTKNHTIGDRFDAGLSRDITVFGNKKAQIRYWNPQITSRQIYYMHIDADTVYTRSRCTSKVEYVTGTQKVEEYDSSFLFTAAAADKLAQAMASAMRLGRYTYKVDSESKVAEGAYVGISVGNGIIATGIILERIYDVLLGVYSYTIRSYDTNYMPVVARTVKLSSFSADDAIAMIASATKAPVFHILGNTLFSYYVGETVPVNASISLTIYPADLDYTVNSYQWYYRTVGGVDTPIVGEITDTLAIDYNEAWFYSGVPIICEINGKYSFVVNVSNTYNASFLGNFASDPIYSTIGDWFFYTGETAGDRVQYTMYYWTGTAWAEDNYATHNAKTYDLISSANSLIMYSGAEYAPTSITINATEQCGDSIPYPYAGRFTTEVLLPNATFSGVYASAIDEASFVFPPSGVASAYRFRLYEAGGFTTKLEEYLLPVTVSAATIDEMAPRYWGSLLAPPDDPGVKNNDYYFDSNTVANGGGELHYYSGGIWVEMTSSHFYYATALKVAMTDIMVWSTAQGATVAAANAVFSSIVASEAFIDQLSATVLNAAIARINENLIVSSGTGFTAGPEGESGLTDGDFRTYLDQDEIKFQEYRDDVWKTLLRLGIDGPVGSRSASLSFGENVASIYQLQKGTGRPVLNGEFVKRVDSELFVEEKTISATSRDWYSVAWSPELGLFVMLVFGSTVCATSPDGITWTERTISATSRNWYVVVWAPELGLFVMAASASAVCATSPDGITWTERTISATSRNWSSLAWAPELGLFVMLVFGSTVCATSPDGITWTERTISAALLWDNLAWSPELGLFLAVARGSPVCATSPDGITWTERTISATTRGWKGVAWSPELGLFVMTASSSTVCATSPDGITWTERTISATSRDWYSIAWSPELGLFLAVAYDSTICATSPDGITWTERTISATSRNWYVVVWAPELGLFLAPVFGSTFCGRIRGYELCELGAGIIESGSNENGYYRKFSDGTLEQWGAQAFDVTTIVNRNIGTYGWSFYTGSVATTFPMAFLPGTTPSIFTTGNDTSATGYGSHSSAASITNAGFLLIGYFYGSAVGIGYSWHAIGRWRA